MKILILGASGLLGSACLRIFDNNSDVFATGTFRSEYDSRWARHRPEQHFQISDVFNVDKLELLFKTVRPSVVINCISLPKAQLNQSNRLEIITTYAILPHRLAEICERYMARLIQISSDGVFSGKNGNYSEEDVPDATDLYGRAKLLGEVTRINCITLRTSMVGHGPDLRNGLIDWFLSQRKFCRGYPEAIFSGFPVSVLAQIIRDFVIPYPELCGIYHVGSDPISKLELLTLVDEIYNSHIVLVPDHSVKINRSLNAAKFQRETSYSPPTWRTMVGLMRDDYLQIHK